MKKLILILPFLLIFLLPKKVFAATLTAPASAQPGNIVTVSWSGVSTTNPSTNSTNDWIGLYAPGTAAGAVGYTDWIWASGCSQTTPANPSSNTSCPFTIDSSKVIVSGDYQFRFIHNSSVIATSSSIAITVPAPAPAATPSFSVPDSATPNGIITVSWENVPNSQNAWIGFYPPNINWAPNTANYLDWFWVNNTGSSGCSKTQNSQSSSGSCQFTIPTNKLTGGGTYHFSLIQITNGTGAVLASEDITINSPILTFDQSKDYKAGDTIRVSWSNVTDPADNDWIGLYKQGALNGEFKAWFWTANCAIAGPAPSNVTARSTGSCDLTIPADIQQGNYEFRFLPQNTYNNIAVSATVKVVANLTITPAANQISVNPGTPVTVNWSGTPNPINTDWVGIYAPGTAAGKEGFIDWFWTGNTSSACSQTAGSTGRSYGSCSFTIPSGITTGGAYEFRLIHDGIVIATSSTLAVVPINLSVSPTAVNPQKTVTVTWDNILNPQAHDWIALYQQGAGNTAYKAWCWTGNTATSGPPPSNGLRAGSCELTIPDPDNAPGGTYEARFLPANGNVSGYTNIATSNQFTVRYTFINGQVQGNAIRASWRINSSSNTDIATTSDWIGLYRADPGYYDEDYNPRAAKYVNCKLNNIEPISPEHHCDFDFKDSSGQYLPGGNTVEYEFRLFKNNSLDIIAKSTPAFSITGPAGSTSVPSICAPSSNLNIRIQDGLTSAPANANKYSGDDVCVFDPKSTFVPYKLPAYNDLRSLYFDQAKTTSSITKLIRSNAAGCTSDSSTCKPCSPDPGNCTHSDIPMTPNLDHLYYIQKTTTTEGNLTIDGNISGNQTGVVFVDGNLNINQDITGNNTSGLVFVVKGNVNIDRNVNQIDAVIISESTIYTAGANCIKSTVLYKNNNSTLIEALEINGSLISLNPNQDAGIKFCRVLSGSNDPAEVINHEVKYLVLLRNLLSDTWQKWSELDANTPIPSAPPTAPPTIAPAPPIAASPSTVAPGGNVTVSFNGLTSATDWIGIYTPGSANNTFKNWVYANCTRNAPPNIIASGSCNMSMTNTDGTTSLPAGTYELRLLSNNRSDTGAVVATSNQVIVR